MIEVFNSFSYEERLKRTGLLSLESRRTRADLIEVFRILKQIDKITADELFNRRTTSHRTRGHSMMLFKGQVRLNTRKFSFSQRVINELNKLPEKVIISKTVNEFKSNIEDIMRKSEGQYISLRLTAPITRATENP